MDAIDRYHLQVTNGRGYSQYSKFNSMEATVRETGYPAVSLYIEDARVMTLLTDPAALESHGRQILKLAHELHEKQRFAHINPLALTTHLGRKIDKMIQAGVLKA